MKAKGLGRGVVGLGLCAIGMLFVLAVRRPEQHIYRIDAGGCRLVTDIVEPVGGTPQGFVVLYHGLSANKRIMSYWTEGFASQGLRVFVPDLPGHGRTEGPFSFERAEECGERLFLELAARGALAPKRTILVGHSMGGAIALRLGSHEPVAGVVAISPAPMRAIPGIPAEAIPYHDFGKLPAHSLLMNGTWEAGRISQTSKDLVSASTDGTSEYLAIPHATHVSLLFDSAAMSAAQNWVKDVLQLEGRPALPTHRGVLGFFVGLVGIVTLVGPFLRELLEDKKRAVEAPASEANASAAAASGVPGWRLAVEFGVLAMGAVGVLHYGNPLRVLRLFEGDYFAALLLILGAALLALHASTIRREYGRQAKDSSANRPGYIPVLLAAFAAVLLGVLFGAWLDFGVTEVWPTTARLVGVLPFMAAVLPYHYAEEFGLGQASGSGRAKRLATALGLRLLVWGVLVAGIYVLHSGEILPVLLAPYFGLFCLGQRWGMDVVREVTGSPSASAVFGAILLAGFCLVAFPAT